VRRWLERPRHAFALALAAVALITVGLAIGAALAGGDDDAQRPADRAASVARTERIARARDEATLAERDAALRRGARRERALAAAVTAQRRRVRALERRVRDLQRPLRRAQRAG
jgi:predicted RNase H-like nuclease (RuvC/YqgF family)